MPNSVFESLEKFNPRQQGSQRFMAIPIAILVGLPDLRCDLYVQLANSSQKQLYRSSQTDLPIADDEKLLSQNVRHLYMRVEDEWLYEQAIKNSLAVCPVDPSLYLSLTLEHQRTTFQVALLSNTVAPLVEASEKLAHDLLAVVQRDDFSVSKVVGLLNHDHCTFQHSCNVAVYASTLAKRLGMSAPDLELLATGGLLHDIGKRHIPGFILRKPGQLTHRERELIRGHPCSGFLELAAIGQLNWAQLMMVYQHHEWLNGRGYPVGSTNDEIHLWARICAIADVFDALTANRPYRQTSYTAQALQIMQKEAGHFDPELFALWTELVSQ